MSNSLLFSPTCLDPLQGLIDFVGATKPYHTKIFDTGVTFSFRDDIVAVLSEDFHTVVESTFNTHRGECEPDTAVCPNEGFEVNVWEDDVGYEPTKLFSTTNIPNDFPTHTRSVLGEPLYYEVDACDPDNESGNRRFRETSVVTLSVDAVTNRYRISLLKPSLVQDGDDITFTTTKTTLARRPKRVVVELYNQVEGNVYTLRLVSPPTSDAALSWFVDTYELVEQVSGAYLTASAPAATLPLMGTGYDIRIRDAYGQACPEGFEAEWYEVVQYEGLSEDCLSTCDGVFAGAPPPPDCASPTTVRTNLCETLTILDDVEGVVPVVLAPPIE